MQLDGRVALVTGASRGVGAGIAVELARRGADVAVNFRRQADEAAEVVAAVEELGRAAVAVQGAVGLPDDEERMVAETASALGPVDLLVNNAGIASRGSALVDTDPAEIERLLQVHAVGPARLCRLVLPAMRERPRGDIVMISSVATRSWGPNGVPYNMGKGAMEALAFTLAKEERVHGVHVNVVAPGLVETEMGRRLMKALRDVDDLRDLDATMPFGRVCQPGDVARVVAFVCSDDAGYLTGERLYVDGGGQQ